MSQKMRHFAGDLYADAGIWSPSSSAANFCEEDYAVTIYIAEFINSLSNFAYMYFALRYAGRPSGQFDLMAASLFLVGVASFLFHATLRQTAQFSDDLSMLFLAASLIQRLYCANQPHFRVSVSTAVIYGITCAASGFYIQSGNLLVHNFLFAAMLTFVWPRTLYLIHLHAGSADAKARLLGQFKSACAYLAIAFLVWNIDLKACQELRNLRKLVGLPWAWLLELHGWWHILTAVGAAQYMQLISDLC